MLKYAWSVVYFYYLHSCAIFFVHVIHKRLLIMYTLSPEFAATDTAALPKGAKK